MARILVPDYPGMQVVSGIKQLAIHGDTCDLAWDLHSIDYLFKSRYISEYFKVPKPTNNETAYIQAVEKILQNDKYDLLLPFGNNAYHAICMVQERIKKLTRILVPSKKNHIIAYDKYQTFEHCQHIGIPVPRTYYGFVRNDLREISNSIQFPIVIKTKSGTGVKNGLRFANSTEELLKRYDEMVTIHSNSSEPHNLVIQEFIPGYIHDACSVAARGKTLEILTQVRHWMYPITGGVGAINYTTKNDSVKALAEQVLESLSWSGPSQIEFKYDERDKKYKLIEINSKFWGTLDLSIRSGVNFPLLLRNFVLDNSRTSMDYRENNYYFFLFPQAVSAGLQRIQKFGFKSLKINKKISKRFYDIDLSDPLPMIFRIFKTLIDILLGRTAKRSLNLEKMKINK
jgi:predicted ATP-grasp superfamily ATP-dependent carboligase